ncbi:putative L-xylulose 5-phosphate 3-epimerase [uncultured Ruminococcus sp.]|uniref:Sugar phosphate isomerase/epimerase n=1 Tax=Massiliimalia timonensis TaxID=1987501 RepID=A0A8J6P976_9FIRM|nr:sugar phosphate isomerase/epimerase family protein [Massiliimalia timonensis]MBC8611639.1 sugar phosphate isomerase/epimerase [Massiliimalia timonensis]MBS7176145.1 sugar phosphate isomerase/epimerase [Clostridiales bacterium]SCH57176.1 putative L-xylulose 5-phosphate 3-epimerase [uncultured Clostridium sp.]SCH69407.1 putative L-xylulose 5-phosphate 3-epimerase [uncultured Ruminococcus sp.]
MYHFSIGVMLESFRTDIPNALKKAALLGAQGIQVYATTGELSPEMMTKEKRREFLKMVKDHGLIISALCGDLGHGFGNPEKNPELLEKSKRILDLAKELETDIVTTHIGVVPADPAHPRYGVMQQACFELAQYADSLDAHFAIETGPETSATLKRFLDGLHSTGVAVNLDPANLVMVTEDDPVRAVHTLKDYIVHTHAKDGRRNFYRDPEVIYGLVEEEMLASESFTELPLGEGKVPFPEYLKALDEIGYHGFLTIEREVGEEPEKDIQTAMAYLKALIK